MLKLFASLFAAALLAAGLLFAQPALTAHEGRPDERSMMGPGMMGHMMGMMGQMMQGCQGMMQDMPGGPGAQKPNSQWRKVTPAEPKKGG